MRTSCSMPKERYFPSGGRGGGKRLRNSGGRDKRANLDFDGDDGVEED